MKTNAYMLGMCLAVVCAFSSLRTNAQTTRPATKAPVPQATPSTGSFAPTNENEASQLAAQPNATHAATARRARGSEITDVKAFRAEFNEWLKNTPDAKEQLDATELDLYRRNEWVMLYNYRKNKSAKTN